MGEKPSATIMTTRENRERSAKGRAYLSPSLLAALGSIIIESAVIMAHAAT